MNITIIQNTTEPAGGAVLNDKSWISLNITPSGSRTISGNVSPGSSLIKLNGAGRVTIEGLNSSGNSLTINNTLTANNTSTINFAEGPGGNAANNVIKNCTVLGSSTGALTGTIVFGTGTSGGNSNNTISNCSIGPSSGYPVNAVISLGNPSFPNRNNIIRDCNIYSYGNLSSGNSAGVFISTGSTDFSIINNRFYQPSNFTVSTNTEHCAVKIENTSGNNFQVTGNTIGFSSAAETGIYDVRLNPSSAFIPISVSAASANISGNTISSIIVYGSLPESASPFKCISVKNGTVSIANNIIGKAGTGPGQQVSLGYGLANSSAEIYSIYLENNLSAHTVRNNTIGGIGGTIGSSQKKMRFIESKFGVQGGNLTCTQNKIVNNNPYPVQFLVWDEASGIHVTGPGTSTISGNTLNNIGSAYANNVTGIFSENAGNSLIEGNFIYSLYGVNNAYGINIQGGTNICQNNMLHLFETGINMINLYGIKETGGLNSYYFNSVYLCGNTAGYENSYAFNSSNADGSVIKNNIFYNARTNTSLTQKNYSIGINSSSSVNSDYNILYADGISGVLGSYNNSDIGTLALWKTSTSLDANSISRNPEFTDVTSVVPDLHINSSSPTPVEQAGTLISSVTNDYDGQQRSALSPVDIGADAGNFTVLPLSLNLKMFVEGFYDSGTNLLISDTVKTFLRDPDSPYNIIDSSKGVVNPDGNSSFAFPNAAGGTYYIEVPSQQHQYLDCNPGFIYTRNAGFTGFVRCI